MEKLKELEAFKIDELSLLRMMEINKRLNMIQARQELNLICEQINRLEKKVGVK
jgi:hypothetical protein